MGKVILEKLIVIIYLVLIIGGITFLFTSVNSTIIDNEKLRRQMVTLQLDRDELKQHTDQLVEIVVTQQYQIDTLVGMLEK